MANGTLPIAIVGSGMVTAVGFNARATCAAIRAKISGIQQGNIWDGNTGDYVNVGRPRTLQWWEGPDMLAELAAPAVVECLENLPIEADQQKVPIFVLLCSKDSPHRDQDLENIVREQLQQRLPFKSTANIITIDRGRTGILHAIRATGEVFKNTDVKHSVVVGVDTFLRQQLVNTYIEQRRVLTSDNSNGFLPGEAACAVLLAPSSQQTGGELRIIGWGEGIEEGTIDSEKPLTGDGMTQAIRSALKHAGLTMAEIDYWLTDQNGEHYKFKETTIAKVRLERLRKEPRSRRFEIWHPIEYLGEIGAAIAPCLLAISLNAHVKGYAPGPRSLIHVSEDNGKRAALVLEWVGKGD